MAHGGDLEKISAEQFGEIMVMYRDGMIGNRALLVQHAVLTAGIFNALSDKSRPPYEVESLLAGAKPYFVKERTEDQKTESMINMVKAMAMMSGLKPPMDS